MGIIYEPNGKAREYADLACSVYLACTHACTYCYCPEVLHVPREEYFKKPQPRSHFLKELSNDARKLAGDKRNVLLSFVGDCYQVADDEYRLTRQAIEVLHAHGLHVTILTKGGARAMRDFDILRPGDSFGVTLTCLDRDDSLKWEPGAALPEERIESLREAHRMGIETWVSCEPVLFPEQTLELIKLTHSFVDEYKLGRLNYHPRAKTLNWRAYVKSVIELLDSLEKKYYLKKDLCKYL